MKRLMLFPPLSPPHKFLLLLPLMEPPVDLWYGRGLLLSPFFPPSSFPACFRLRKTWLSWQLQFFFFLQPFDAKTQKFFLRRQKTDFPKKFLYRNRITASLPVFLKKKLNMSTGMSRMVRIIMCACATVLAVRLKRDIVLWGTKMIAQPKKVFLSPPQFLTAAPSLEEETALAINHCLSSIYLPTIFVRKEERAKIGKWERKRKRESSRERRTTRWARKWEEVAPEQAFSEEGCHLSSWKEKPIYVRT